jgi:hypothetical protein
MNETVNVPASPSPTGFLWFFRNGDSWSAPQINNGLPYLPSISNQMLRNFLWFCRNPIGNFMGFVIGVEGYDYSVTGPAPVMLTTLYDATPPRFGWKWSIIKCGWSRLPFVSYSGKTFLWYLGWRPASGGFGFKFNIHFAMNGGLN